MQRSRRGLWGLEARASASEECFEELFFFGGGGGVWGFGLRSLFGFRRIWGLGLRSLFGGLGGFRVHSAVLGLIRVLGLGSFWSGFQEKVWSLGVFLAGWF